MNTRLPHTAHRKRVYGLWIGDQLPFLAELSIRSYLNQGVEFCLFSYKDYDNLPEGALRMDANQLIDASLIYRHAGGSYAPFADWFRNKWLSEHGGVWTELDMLCLSSEELPDASQPWFALQEPGLAAVGIIAFPPHHPVIDTLLELSEDPANEAPWDDDATRQNKQHIREQLPDPATRRQLAAWGHAGSEGFTQAVQHYHELDQAAPTASIYPIHYTVWRHCYDGSVRQQSEYFKHSWAVHAWNDMLCKEPYDIRDIHPQSIVGALIRELMPHALPSKQPPAEALHPLSALESLSDTKILVGICSCTKSAAAQRRDAVRRTWMSAQADGVQCAFFVGRGDPLDEDHCIQLPSDDSYEYLPEKVLDFFDYALANLHFEWIFKCDDDTYLDLERLPELCELDCDFVGNPWLSSRGAPSGGAGYLLSRSLVERIVAHRNEIPLRGAEDVLIGQLALSLCERAHASPRLNYGKYPFPLASNDIISAHWLAPSDLDWLHQHRRDKPCFRLWGRHPHWQDYLSFYPSGFFIREASGCTGRWEITTQDVLELHWDGWGAEALHPSPSGYQAGAFELHSEESLHSFYEQCIAIIPAKEHSLRCPRKNKRPFLQEPLFLHSVNYATQEGIRPIVSTDSAEIKDICLRYNIDYIDETVDDSDMSHCVAQVLAKIHCSYFAILQPTSPLRKKGLLRQMLLKSYAQRGSTIITTADHKLIGFIDKKFYVAYRDQDTATRFRYFDGSILTCGRDRFMETRQLFGEDVQPQPNEYPCTLQIDSEDEFTSLEAIARDPSFHKYLPPSRPKKICIIANKLDLQRDYSEFIDSCDIVIRINKMCNLKPGLTGSKIDMAFVSCWQGYHRYPRHLRESDRLKDIPLIYFHLPERPMVEQLIRDEGITSWSYLPASVESSTHACTSFTKTVALAAAIYPHDELYILADTDVDTRTNHYGYHSHSADNQILASLIDSGRLISITEDEISSHTSYSRPASIEKLRQQERQSLLLGADKSTFASIKVAHKHWNDTLLLGAYYARRQGPYHIATILERSHNSITLEWEDYGVEHLRADENMVYRLQQETPS